MKVILDTDLGGDIDDLGALAVLHALANADRCEILGIISDTPQPDAVSAIDAVNRWYGRPDLPVGRRHTLRHLDTYATAVARASQNVLSGHNAPLAVDVYRRLLANAPDRSVTIVTIGVLFLVNDLLDSESDEVSSMNGFELVDAKVDRFVMMGGNYPTNTSLTETNFHAWNTPGVTKRCIERIKRPIAFVGGELGDRVNGYGTGAGLNGLPIDHPVRIGYTDFFRRPPSWVPDSTKPWSEIQPWSIWDQIAVHHAVCRDSEVYEEVRGLNQINESGTNVFTPDDSGSHTYLVPKVAPRELSGNLIEPLMLAAGGQSRLRIAPNPDPGRG